MVGRSHGIHAEPITFGLKLALFYAEISRHLTRWDAELEVISVGKISGAVGNLRAPRPGHGSAKSWKRSGLSRPRFSNQIIQRDRHAAYFFRAGPHRIECGEDCRRDQALAALGGRRGQKSFSTRAKRVHQPCRTNAIRFSRKNLSGLARVIRGNAMAAMEDVPLWHERDISHSSVERIIAPDSTILADFMLCRLSSVIRNMTVYPEKDDGKPQPEPRTYLLRIHTYPTR